MPNDSGTVTILDQSGERGRVIKRARGDDGASYLAVERESGTRVLVPFDAVQSDDEDGDLRIDDDFDAHRTIADDSDESFATTIPVVEEEFTVAKREVESGTVRIHTSVDERTEVIDVPVERQRVEVERIPVNRPADGPVEPRYEGDALVISLLEERIVVQKQLVVTEEVRIRRVTETEQHHEEVPLRIERAEIDRIEQ